jgi:hypothetical protein
MTPGMICPFFPKKSEEGINDSRKGMEKRLICRDPEVDQKTDGLLLLPCEDQTEMTS